MFSQVSGCLHRQQQRLWWLASGGQQGCVLLMSWILYLSMLVCSHFSYRMHLKCLGSALACLLNWCFSITMTGAQYPDLFTLTRPTRHSFSSKTQLLSHLKFLQCSTKSPNLSPIMNRGLQGFWASSISSLSKFRYMWVFSPKVQKLLWGAWRGKRTTSSLLPANTAMMVWTESVTQRQWRFSFSTTVTTSGSVSTVVMRSCGLGVLSNSLRSIACSGPCSACIIKLSPIYGRHPS